jgi:hypothetical protein
MESEESERPQDEQDDGDGQEHVRLPLKSGGTAA